MEILKKNFYPAWVESKRLHQSSQSRTFDDFLLSSFLSEDISKSCKPSLPENISLSHKKILTGSLVLQVNDIVDISQPLRKCKEDSFNNKKQYKGKENNPNTKNGSYQKSQKIAFQAKRTLKFCLSDGHQQVYGFEYLRLHQANGNSKLKLKPGAKVIVKNPVIRRGLLLLTNENFQCIGGGASVRTLSELQSSNSLTNSVQMRTSQHVQSTNSLANLPSQHISLQNSHLRTFNGTPAQTITRTNSHNMISRNLNIARSEAIHSKRSYTSNQKTPVFENRNTGINPRATTAGNMPSKNSAFQRSTSSRMDSRQPQTLQRATDSLTAHSTRTSEQRLGKSNPRSNSIVIDLASKSSKPEVRKTLPNQKGNSESHKECNFAYLDEFQKSSQHRFCMRKECKIIVADVAGFSTKQVNGVYHYRLRIVITDGRTVQSCEVDSGFAEERIFEISAQRFREMKKRDKRQAQAFLGRVASKLKKMEGIGTLEVTLTGDILLKNIVQPDELYFNFLISKLHR